MWRYAALVVILACGIDAVKFRGSVIFGDDAPASLPADTIIEVSVAAANRRFRVLGRQAIEPTGFGPGARYTYEIDVPHDQYVFEGYNVRAILYLHRGVDTNHPFTVWPGDWYSDGVFVRMQEGGKSEFSIDLKMQELKRPDGGRFYSAMGP